MIKEQLNLFGLGVTILAIVLLSIFIDMDSVEIWINRAGVWGPLVFILLKASTVVIAPLSGAPLYPIVGLLFGFWPGILYVSLGDILGTSINFWLSRIFGRALILKLIRQKDESVLNKIIDHISQAKGFFHACLTCFALPELLAYAAGLSHLPYIKFITILPSFLLIPSSILVLVGSTLESGAQSALVGLGLPIAGMIAILIGGFFFTKGVMKKDSSNLDA